MCWGDHTTRHYIDDVVAWGYRPSTLALLGLSVGAGGGSGAPGALEGSDEVEQGGKMAGRIEKLFSLTGTVIYNPSFQLGKNLKFYRQRNVGNQVLRGSREAAALLKRIHYFAYGFGAMQAACILIDDRYDVPMKTLAGISMLTSGLGPEGLAVSIMVDASLERELELRAFWDEHSVIGSGSTRMVIPLPNGK